MHRLNHVALMVGMLGATVLFVSTTFSAEETEVELAVGNVAPVFEGTDNLGQVWKSSDRVGKKTVVVYFYPADFTTGCTAHAEAWRDNMNSLVEKGVEVVGVSGDSVLNHKLFKEVWKLSFTLLADEQAAIAKQFGVPTRGGGKVRPRGPDRQVLVDETGEPLVLERKATFARWTFVIGIDGSIVYKNTKVAPAKDSLQVLDFINGVDPKPAVP